MIVRDSLGLLFNCWQELDGKLGDAVKFLLREIRAAAGSNTGSSKAESAVLVGGGGAAAAAAGWGGGGGGGGGVMGQGVAELWSELRAQRSAMTSMISTEAERAQQYAEVTMSKVSDADTIVAAAPLPPAAPAPATRWRPVIRLPSAITAIQASEPQPTSLARVCSGSCPIFFCCLVRTVGRRRRR